MMPGRVLCLAGLLALLAAEVPRAEDAGPDQPYDYAAAPLSGLQTRLLQQARYQVRDDGTVLAPDSQPVPREDLPYIVQRLESGQRLKSLLQINLILNRSEGEREKDLTPEERESIRAIVKENWEIFSLRLRKEFRGYFSLQELEVMNQAPLPRARLAEPALKDMEPEQSVAAQAVPHVPTAPPVSASVAPAVAPAPAAPVPVPAPAPAPVPPAPAVVPARVAPPAPAPVAPAVAVMPAAVPTPAPAPAPISPAPAPAAPIAAAPASGAVPVPSITSPAPAARRTVPAAAVPPAPAAAAPAPAPAVPVVPAVIVATAAPAPAPILASPAPQPPGEPPLVQVPAEAFEKFLTQAPYGREVKALLRLISEKAPFARNRVLNDVMSVVPQIVIDADRTGSRLYSRLEHEPALAPLIALNSGVVMTEESRLFFGRTVTYLPSSAKAYAEAGLPAPDLQALRDGSSSRKEEGGPWGASAVYEDGSRRVSFTPESQAGVLLAELVRLDSRLRRWDASAAGVETAARTAQWLFYRALAALRRSDDFLDPLLRASYREWLENPAAYHDSLILGLSSSRGGVVDPRRASLSAVSAFDRNALAGCVAASIAETAYRDAAARGSREAEIRAYEETDLFSEDNLATARAAAARAPAEAPLPTPCRPEWAAEMAALAKSGAVLGEAVEAEKRMRQEGETHAE